MSFPFNEYTLIRALKTYFGYLKNNESAFKKIYDTMFDVEDVPTTDRDAFKDIVVNNKIDFKVAFTNVSSELPTVVVVMDQEVGRDNPIGNYVGETENGSEYGVFTTGVYAIYAYTKQLLLTRMLSMFIKLSLEHYFTNDTRNNLVEYNINIDRFTPHIDYFPNDVFHYKLTLRCVYMETWEEQYNTLNGVVVMGGIKIDEKADGTIEEIIPFEVDLSEES